MGARSLLLLEGREHLARRKLMLPPFHGERMRAYEATVREVVAREIEGWPEGEAFALHPRMQAITLEVILRAVFGVTDPARATQLGGRARAAAGRHVVVGRAVRRAAVPPLRRPGPARRHGGAAAGDRRDARRRDRRAPRRPARGHPLAARDRPLRGRRADGRRRDPRPADDAAARRARDHRDRAGVDVRPAAPPPARARATDHRDRRRQRRRTCARSWRSRCGCGPSSRSPAGG